MSTPTCPACGAKFSHDIATRSCRKCGCPDEVIITGRVEQWKRGKAEVPQQQQPRIEFAASGTKASKTRKVRRHGNNKGGKKWRTKVGQSSVAAEVRAMSRSAAKARRTNARKRNLSQAG